MKPLNVLYVGINDEELESQLLLAWQNIGGACEFVSTTQEAVRALKNNAYDHISFYIRKDQEEIGVHDIGILRSMTNVSIVAGSPGPAVQDLHVRALRAGADQFFYFPISIEERVEIVLAMIRRTHELNKIEPPPITVIMRNHLLICVEQRLVLVEDKEVKLLPKEFDILLLLCRYPGYWYSPDEIYTKIWHDDIDARNALWSHISRLKAKLKVDPHLPEFIESQRGVGYRFISD